MATKTTPPVPVGAAPSQRMPPAPTPENTPIPGGGSWRWDIAGPGWVENTPDEASQPDPLQE